RFDSRYLLFWYYGLRGLSLIYLPYAFDLSFYGLPVFAVFYGLDWIATVPPTVRLTANVFGKENVGVVFGWLAAAHQLGASGDGERHDAQDEGEGGHQDGPQPGARSVARGGEAVLALVLGLAGELDDQDGVLSGEPDQHDEPDLGQDV